MNLIIPKSENKGVGYTYEVTEEQIREHQKKSIEDILCWLYDLNLFLKLVQTDEEKERMKRFKNKKVSWE